ncbi:aminotransferase class I/II-fold pyridoxal phosphate-dependent enzyme, partial [bacterium]|nr:aminotransferase class I/II-fold pyridoxal phosphate-dependent enzyme [bacterium]
NIFLAGASPYNVRILKQNNFLPVLSDIPSDIAKKAKAFYLNYPNNPTGAVATKKFFSELVEFAKEYDIAICHDNPYSEIVFDEQERLSFLSVEGAKDVGIELNSLSKPYNMTGWRIGMAMGNPDIIAAMSKVKENVDSGIFNAVQYAGIKALEEETQNIDKTLDIYEKSRKLVVDTLNSIGWNYTPPNGTFYLWIPTLNGENSIDFATMLFEKTSVVVAAGSAYGKYGEGYIRISLTVSDKRLQEAMQRIKNALK